MKTVTARDAKNRFGQLIDDAQREPVTIEKNGRPFAVVQSYVDFQEAQQQKLEALRQGIAEARAELAAGRDLPFDRAAVEQLKQTGRARKAGQVFDA